jgi:DNA/RNA endonuclease YhcR with UshA esterase domain
MKKILTAFLCSIVFFAKTQTIADARNQPIGQTVTITGVVTNGSEHGNIRHIQDNTGAIAAYGTIVSSVNRGDSVSITGVLYDYNGLLEISPITNLINHGSAIGTITPLVVPLSVIDEPIEGQLVRVDSVSFVGFSFYSNYPSNGNMQITNGNFSSTVRILSTTNIAYTQVLQQPVSIVGLLREYNGVYQIVPRDLNDIFPYNPPNNPEINVFITNNNSYNYFPVQNNQTFNFCNSFFDPSMSLIFQNVGQQSLNISNVTISGTNSSDFSSSIIYNSINPINYAWGCEITFIPQGTGIRTATINIYSNDLDESPYSINVKTYIADTVKINESIICDTYTSPSGQQYTQSGTYQEVIPNSFGCDSIVTILNLSFPNFLTSNNVQSPYCSETADGHIKVNLSVTSNNRPFISEYSSNGTNHVIELYNPSDLPVDLGDPYVLSNYSTYFLRNSSGQEYQFINFPIIIPAHSSILITAPLINGENIFFGVRNIALSSDVIIDKSPALSSNVSKIRKWYITGGSANFNANDWFSTTAQNTLGTHNLLVENDFEVQWSNGYIGDSLLNVVPSNYSYNIVQISTGCIVSSESQIVVNSSYSYSPSFSSSQQLYTAPPFAVQFTNSSTNTSNYSFTWDFGDGTTSTSNNASVFHQYLYNGLYTVSLIATESNTGCTDTTTLSDYIFCTGGLSCTHTSSINQTSPQQACQGTPLWLTCNSDPSYTYQWRRNGVIISGNNNDSLQVTQSGTYSVIISVNNCPVTSNDVVVNILSAPTTPVISSNGVIQPCVGGSVTLSTGNYASYSWSTGATTQSINVSTSGSYSVNVTGANGCSAPSAPFNVNASFVAPPQVCIVGMDSLTNENRIVWEKPLTLGIDSFYVYKESNVSNIYTKIGAIDYNDLAVFLDVNSNPAVQAYRYKISALDTCGVETNVGDFHKTIHLTINQGVGGAWNLIWSHYEGLAFGSYNIYRGAGLSNMALLTTIQSNLNSYTDLTPPSGAVYYQIEIVNPVNCDPTKSINYGVSRSNIVNNGQGGISEETISSIQVYPNPTNDKLTLDVSNDLLGKSYFITDFAGRIIQQGKITSLKQQVDLHSVSNGSYFLQVEQSTAKAIKIVKQ